MFYWPRLCIFVIQLNARSAYGDLSTEAIPDKAEKERSPAI